VSSLAKQIDKRNQTQTLWTNTKDTLNAAKGSLPIDWENLQAEYKKLSEAEGQIKGLLEVAQNKQREAHNALEKAKTKTKLQGICDRQAHRTGAMETFKITLHRNHSNLNLQIAQLPEDWRANAETMTEEIRLSGSLRGYPQIWGIQLVKKSGD
jgi:hypothetical protein